MFENSNAGLSLGGLPWEVGFEINPIRTGLLMDDNAQRCLTDGSEAISTMLPLRRFVATVSNQTYPYQPNGFLSTNA